MTDQRLPPLPAGNGGPPRLTSVRGSSLTLPELMNQNAALRPSKPVEPPAILEQLRAQNARKSASSGLLPTTQVVPALPLPRPRVPAFGTQRHDISYLQDSKRPKKNGAKEGSRGNDNEAAEPGARPDSAPGTRGDPNGEVAKRGSQTERRRGPKPAVEELVNGDWETVRGNGENLAIPDTAPTRQISIFDDGGRVNLFAGADIIAQQKDTVADEVRRRIVAVKEKQGKVVGEAAIDSVSAAIEREAAKGTLPESQIPEAYHVIRQRPLRVAFGPDVEVTYKDEQKLFSALEFPSPHPSGRNEVMHLARTLDAMLLKHSQALESSNLPYPTLDALLSAKSPAAAMNDFDFGATVHGETECWDIVFAEVVRQVHVHCAERGLLLEKIRSRYIELFGSLQAVFGTVHKELVASNDRNLEMKKSYERLKVLHAEEVLGVERRASAAMEDIRMKASDLKGQVERAHQERWKIQEELFAVRRELDGVMSSAANINALKRQLDDVNMEKDRLAEELEEMRFNEKAEKALAEQERRSAKPIMLEKGVQVAIEPKKEPVANAKAPVRSGSRATRPVSAKPNSASTPSLEVATPPVENLVPAADGSAPPVEGAQQAPVHTSSGPATVDEAVNLDDVPDASITNDHWRNLQAKRKAKFRHIFDQLVDLNSFAGMLERRKKELTDKKKAEISGVDGKIPAWLEDHEEPTNEQMGLVDLSQFDLDDHVLEAFNTNLDAIKSRISAVTGTQFPERVMPTEAAPEDLDDLESPRGRRMNNSKPKTQLQRRLKAFNTKDAHTQTVSATASRPQETLMNSLFNATVPVSRAEVSIQCELITERKAVGTAPATGPVLGHSHNLAAKIADVHAAEVRGHRLDHTGSLDSVTADEHEDEVPASQRLAELSSVVETMKILAKDTREEHLHELSKVHEKAQHLERVTVELLANLAKLTGAADKLPSPAMVPVGIGSGVTPGASPASVLNTPATSTAGANTDFPAVTGGRSQSVGSNIRATPIGTSSPAPGSHTPQAIAAAIQASVPVQGPGAKGVKQMATQAARVSEVGQLLHKLHSTARTDLDPEAYIVGVQEMTKAADMLVVAMSDARELPGISLADRDLLQEKATALSRWTKTLASETTKYAKRRTVEARQNKETRRRSDAGEDVTTGSTSSRKERDGRPSRERGDNTRDSRRDGTRGSVDRDRTTTTTVDGGNDETTTGSTRPRRTSRGESDGRPPLPPGPPPKEIAPRRGRRQNVPTDRNISADTQPVPAGRRGSGGTQTDAASSPADYTAVESRVDTRREIYQASKGTMAVIDSQTKSVQTTVSVGKNEDFGGGASEGSTTPSAASDSMKRTAQAIMTTRRLQGRVRDFGVQVSPNPPPVLIARTTQCNLYEEIAELAEKKAEQEMRIARMVEKANAKAEGRFGDVVRKVMKKKPSMKPKAATSDASTQCDAPVNDEDVVPQKTFVSRVAAYLRQEGRVDVDELAARVDEDMELELNEETITEQLDSLNPLSVITDTDALEASVASTRSRPSQARIAAVAEEDPQEGSAAAVEGSPSMASVAGGGSTGGGTLTRSGSVYGSKTSLNKSAGVIKGREFRTRNAMLAGIFRKFQGTKGAKPKIWLLRLISNVQRDKATVDALADRNRQPHLPMPDFLYKYLKEKYGTRSLVEANLGSVVLTVQQYRGSDLSIDTFGKFLEETWNVGVLNLYMKAIQLIDHLQLRFFLSHFHVLILCQVGLSYPVSPHALTAPRYVCLKRADVITSMLLGQRAPQAAAPFANRLAQHSVPADERDLAQIYTAAFQQLNRDAPTAATESYSKILRDQFLFMLCEEHLLLEQHFAKYLPTVFQNKVAHIVPQLDQPSNTMGKFDFYAVMRELSGNTLNDAAIEPLWSGALLHSQTQSEGFVDQEGFQSVADATDALRRQFRYSYVPVYKNLHEELVSAATQRMLMRVISKHWTFYRVLFEEFLPQFDGNRNTKKGYSRLLELKQLLERVLDGFFDGSRASALYRRMLYMSTSQLLELRQADSSKQNDPKLLDSELDFLENVVLDLVKRGKGRQRVRPPTGDTRSRPESPEHRNVKADDSNKNLTAYDSAANLSAYESNMSEGGGLWRQASMASLNDGV